MTAAVRVRIAPSPTGNLHVGTARAALFNYLFAKGQGGQFILRIEDTDKERSTNEYEKNIFDSLHALGLQWDEGPDVGGHFGPYRQSERAQVYAPYAEKLLEAGLAYYSYDTEEELTKQRNAAQLAGAPYAYRAPDAKTLAEQAKDPSRTKTLRFKIPEPYETIVVNDAIRGQVEFDSSLFGDFVILKSDGSATFNFANVVDDTLMRITHIIRGEDHLSNTPRQILLYRAFAELGLSDGTIPTFAHASMILAPDRTKLSKRFGATAVSEYVAQGYLPEAFCNFLALLGWTPKDAEEINTLEGFAPQFTLDRIAKSPAIFETDKLNWLNKQHLKQLSDAELLEKLTPFIDKAQWNATYSPEQQELIVNVTREPLTVLSDITEATEYLFGETIAMSDEVKTQVFSDEASLTVLNTFEAELEDNNLDLSSPEAAGASVKTLLTQLKPLKPKQVMWPIRAAISGRTHGADMSALLYLLGRDRLLARVADAKKQLAVTA